MEQASVIVRDVESLQLVHLPAWKSLRLPGPALHNDATLLLVCPKCHECPLAPPKSLKHYCKSIGVLDMLGPEQPNSKTVTVGLGVAAAGKCFDEKPLGKKAIRGSGFVLNMPHILQPRIYSRLVLARQEGQSNPASGPSTISAPNPCTFSLLLPNTQNIRRRSSLCCCVASISLVCLRVMNLQVFLSFLQQTCLC